MIHARHAGAKTTGTRSQSERTTTSTGAISTPFTADGVTTSSEGARNLVLHNSRTSVARPDLRRLLVPDGPLSVGSYVRVLCPFHGDKKKASGSVYDDHFWCYTCGTWVSRWDFLRTISDGGVVVRGVVSNGEANPYLPPTLAGDYAHILWTVRRDRLAWFHERGLTDESIRAAGLGHTGRAFTIPIFLPRSRGGVQTLAGGTGIKELAAIKYRSDPYYDTCEDECTCPKYWGVKGRNRGLLYDASLSSLRNGGMGGKDHQARRAVVLTEGELDALLLWQYGIPAVSHINGSKPELSTFAPLRALPQVVVAYDQDQAGQTGALRVRDYLGNARIVTWHVQRDAEGHVIAGPKDVTEFIQQRGIDAFRKLARI